MQFSKSKATTIAISLFLMLTMAFTLVALPANAQPGTTLKTYPFVDAIPNPVGVGEDVLIRFGILMELGSVEYGWSDLTVTVVKPDDTTQTLGPKDTDSTGSTYEIFTPTEAGTYKLTAHFPEQPCPMSYYYYEGGFMIMEGTTMEASTSETINLVVQEEALPSYPGHPLPAEYWSRPIDNQLREWAPISGNWLMRPPNAFAPYNDDAPETAHVLWAKELTTGGQTGGYLGEGQVPAGAETGDAYEGKFIGSVIMNGILYYNKDAAQSFVPENNAIVAVDLRTGEELWRKEGLTLSFGQTLYFNSWNDDGVYNYLWVVTSVMLPDRSYNYTWTAYDPFDGQWIYSMYNVPGSAPSAYGPSGEMLIYQMDFANARMLLWNSTAAGQANPNYYGPGSMLGNKGSWAAYMAPLVHGATFDANVTGAFTWNVSIPAGLSVSASFGGNAWKFYPDRIVGMAYNRTRVRVWALDVEDLSPSSTAITTTKFDTSWNAPDEWLEGYNTLHYTGATNDAEDGVIAVWSKELRRHYGFSTEDGSFMWETDSEHFSDAYGWGNAEHTWYFAYGHLYSVGVGGIFYAYDDQTGDVDWLYNMTDAYNEPVTGANWWGWMTMITDGKVYLGTLEHSAEQALPRGGPYICLNATDGTEIFRVNGMFRQTRWGGCAIMGDSIIATMDTYDQRIYAIGKGPSATTVSASPKVSTHGGSVIVEGMVTDISAGTEEYRLSARFPNGVPAVADENMSEWMLYVYKQFERPADVVGVDVVVSVFDPNTNCYDVTTATSDENGFYSAVFTPEVPGKYTIIASFEGSKAYYGSSALTAINVEEAPAATPEPTPVPASAADLYFLPVSIGMIIAIVIVLVLLILMYRKR